MKYFYLIVALLFTLPLYGGFSRSGTIITQTDTDTDLSELRNIPGVTVSSQADIEVYNIGNRRLVIEGTLTIDPESEMLIIGYASGELLRVQGSGHLIIGQAITQNSYTRYSTGTAIYLEDSPTGFTNRVSFYNNSRLTWNGGTVSLSSGKFGFYGNGVNVNINSTNATLIYRTQDPQNQIRQETNNFTSTGFTFINGDMTIVGTGQQLNGYSTIHCTGALAFSGATPNVDVPIRAYAGGDQGNTADIKHWSGSRPVLINSKTGSQLNCGPHIAGNGGSYGVALVRQELALSVTDDNNNPIAGAKYFIRDTNNGNRETYNKEGHVVNNTQDFSYEGTSDASGNMPLQTILLAANVVNTGNGDAPNTGNYAWDYRGKNNDDSDLFDVHIWSYNHSYSLLSDLEMKGINPVKATRTLVKDLNVTVPTLAAAQSIGGIAITHDAGSAGGSINISGTVTLCDIYDFIKANKLDNLAEPSIATLATQINGGSLNAGDYQIVLAPGSKLRTCDKFTKIESNVISLIDDPSANLEVALTDPNGSYKLIELQNIETSDVEIVDNNGPTTLSSATNFTGTYTFVTQSNSDNVSIAVRRENYNDWGVDIDLTTDDVFRYFVNQSFNLSASATLENQDRIIYLSRKILQKEETILALLNGSGAANLTVNGVNQTGTLGTKEKQSEILDLLKRILAKTTATRVKVEK